MSVYTDRSVGRSLLSTCLQSPNQKFILEGVISQFPFVPFFPSLSLPFLPFPLFLASRSDPLNTAKILGRLLAHPAGTTTFAAPDKFPGL